MGPRLQASAIPVRRTPLERVGLQLYTVRDAMATDLERTIARVAEIGYTEVEFAGYHDRTPRELREIIDRVGLTAPAAHIPLNTLQNDWDRTLEAAHWLGHKYLVVPWLAAEERADLDGYRRLADTFNRLGERARESGMRFGYHNHAFELEPMDGEIPLELLIRETDPANVTFEMDMFWIVKGGGDPIDYITRFPGRFAMVHAKDIGAAGEMTEVGSGMIDFAAFFAHPNASTIQHSFVEHDSPAAPFDSIRTSFSALSTFRPSTLNQPSR